MDPGRPDSLPRKDLLRPSCLTQAPLAEAKLQHISLWRPLKAQTVTESFSRGSGIPVTPALGSPQEEEPLWNKKGQGRGKKGGGGEGGGYEFTWSFGSEVVYCVRAVLRFSRNLALKYVYHTQRVACGLQDWL